MQYRSNRNGQRIFANPTKKKHSKEFVSTLKITITGNDDWKCVIAAQKIVIGKAAKYHHKKLDNLLANSLILFSTI